MSPARLRGVSLAVVALLAGLEFLAWSQTWFRIALAPHALDIGGDVAGAALPALALASLALVLALALAGPAFRIILALLEALLGVGVITVTSFALANPLVASAPSITKATGLSGSTAAYAGDVAATGWPVVAIVGGCLMVLCGLFLAITVRSWPRSGRRFSRTRATPGAGAGSAEPDLDPVREWDALSEGDDPTRPSP
ncbi:hypothetical protein GCM10009840_22410 [Pseudolysinimonas kribbensis]|uniref:Trp biosynthesis-associated membrane protein n=1 Tax=Pseudolysinimonas kribbensis TaxID=433641 RepID=UPI0031E30DE2